jgi:hypothetical protein
MWYVAAGLFLIGLGLNLGALFNMGSMTGETLNDAEIACLAGSAALGIVWAHRPWRARPAGAGSA